MKKLQATKSICPACHKSIDAEYIEDGGRVFMRKACPEHGEYESCIADCEDDFVAWTAHPVINVPPKKAITKGASIDESFDSEFNSQCPLHCGTCENHMQTACCVLIDVTEKCNQHCPYCFSRSGEITALDPSLAEIERKYDLLLELGEKRSFNIQLSGGEPTVREDLPDIIKMGREKGFEYIQINTNGRRLATDDDYAKALKGAGATVIYLQFDGTDDMIYGALRGEALLAIKIKAIENCRKAGLPVILVPMVVKNVNLSNIASMMEFLLENVDVIKGIHFQPVSYFGRHPEKSAVNEDRQLDFKNRVTMFDIMHELEKQSGGMFKYNDFCPITSGHTLCCFYGTYGKQKDGSVQSFVSDKMKTAGVSCCDTASPLDIIRKDRDFVLNKWDLPEQDGCCGCADFPSDESPQQASGCEQPMSFDQFIAEMKSSMFTVSGMAFQDINNLDAERLKRCRVQVLSSDDRLIPFCAYNSIYRI